MLKRGRSSVVVTKDFKNESSFTLVPLTNTIIIGKTPPGGQHVCLGSLETFGLDSERAFAKSVTAWPAKGADIMKSGGCFLTGFWNVEHVSDPNDANCTIIDVNAISVKVMNKTYVINLPLMKNTKALTNGQELKCYVQKEKVAPVEEPPAKKPKIAGKAAAPKRH